MTNKRVCTYFRCGWRGTDDQVLRATHPFQEMEIIGCPDCREVETVSIACDEPGCWEAVTCGFPSKKGYRNVCSKHYRELGLKNDR